jgi:hypothetical protein
MLRVAQRERIPVHTSPAAVAQVRRNGARQAQLARSLAGVEVPPLDLDTDRPLGALLATTNSSDVVDAHVASPARAGDQVLTSDPEDLRNLLDALSVEADLVQV